MTTLADYFGRLRKAKKLSLSQVASNAGVDKTNPWKIEQARSVSADMLRRVCVDGLGLSEDSREYAEIVALWVWELGLSQSPQPEIGKTLAKLGTASARRIDASARKIAVAIKDMPASDRDALCLAMEDPDSRAALIALSRHYSGAKNPA